MARTIYRVGQAFYTRKTKNSMLLMFWSEDWYHLKPWTVDGKNVGYISKHVLVREQGRMTSLMLGPLLVVYYKNNLTSQ